MVCINSNSRGITKGKLFFLLCNVGILPVKILLYDFMLGFFKDKGGKNICFMRFGLNPNEVTKKEIIQLIISFFMFNIYILYSEKFDKFYIGFTG